jgi:hypothetical protein
LMLMSKGRTNKMTTNAATAIRYFHCTHIELHELAPLLPHWCL